MVRSLVPAEEAVGDLVHRAQYDRWTPRTCLSCLCCKFHVGYCRPTYHVRQSMSCQCSSRDEMRCQPYLLHGYVGNAFMKHQSPTQEDPPGPRTTPRKQGGHRDRKPTKSAKTSQKHVEKHPKAPERPQSGGTGVPPAPPERERGRAKTESEQNYVYLAYRPLAVCCIETLNVFWLMHFYEKIFLFGKVKPRNQSHPILE